MVEFAMEVFIWQLLTIPILFNMIKYHAVLEKFEIIFHLTSFTYPYFIPIPYKVRYDSNNLKNYKWYSLEELTYSNILKLDYDLNGYLWKSSWNGLFNFYFYIWKYFANKIIFMTIEIKSVLFLFTYFKLE